MARRLAWLALPVALAVPGLAHAAPRSLASATARLPDTVEMVATSNLKGVRSTQLFSKLFPKLIKEADDLSKGIDGIKKTCKLDPVNGIEDATVALDKNDEGAFFVALAGVDEAKAVDCAGKLAKEELGGNTKVEKVTSKADGTLYRVTSDKSREEVFFAYLPGDVIVVASDEDDKALLEKLLSGKGAIKKSKLSGRLAKLDPNAALSAVWSKVRRVEGKNVRGGDVTVTVQSGVVSANGSAELDTADDAKEVASMVQMLKMVLGKSLSSAKIDATASGSNVVVKAEVPESDLLRAIGEKLKF